MVTALIRNLGMMGCFAVAIAATPAAAAQQGSGSFQVSATVPMACWVNQTAQSDDGPSGIGGLATEGCNSASGYVVSAVYRPLFQSESARFVYGNSAFDLSSLGTQEVHREYGPGIRQISYHVDAMVLEAPLALSLTIQPI